MKKVINRIIILGILWFSAIAGYAQMPLSDIEKDMETAALSIRSALLNNQNADVSASIDVLEKYLNNEPDSLNVIVKYYSILTLNAYYLEKEIPKIDYNVLIRALLATREVEFFHDPFYITCAQSVAAEYENYEQYEQAFEVYKMALEACTTYYGAQLSFYNYIIQKSISNLHFKLNNMPEWLAALEKASDVIERISAKENEIYMTNFYLNDMEALSLAYQLNNQYKKSDSILLICQKYLETNKLQHTNEYIEIVEKRANVKRMLPVPQYKEAIELYEKILSLQKKDTPQYAGTLLEISWTYREMEDLKQTKYYADKSATIAQKDPLNNIEILFSLIQLYKQSNGTEQARKLIKNLSFDPQDNLFLLSKMAYMYALIDDYPQSYKYVEQAKMQADKKIASGEFTADFADELGDLTNALLVLEEHEDVIKYQKINLEITGQMFGKEHRITRQMRRLLAEQYSLAGYYDKAMDILDALAQNQNESDAFEISREQANIYMATGNFNKAISIYETMLSKPMNPLTKYGILLSLTGCYVSEADLLRDEGKNNDETSISLINKAHEYISQLLTISQENFGTNSEQYIQSLSQIATVYCLLDSIPTARKHIDNCLSIIRENNFPDSEKASYLGLAAFTYAEIKDFQKAIELGEEMKKIEDKITNKNPVKEYSTLFLLSESYLGNHNFEKAQHYYSALYKNIAENIQNNFSYMTEQQRNNYLRIYQNQLYNAGKFMDVSNKKDAFATVLYDVTLFSKGLLLRTTNDIRDAIYTSGNQSLVNDFEQLGNLRKQISKLQQKDDYDKNDMQTLENQANSLEKNIMQTSKTYSEFKDEISITWQEVQKQLDTNEVAIEFVHFRLNSDTSFYCALILKKGAEVPIWIPLFEEKQLQTLTKRERSIIDSEFVNQIYTGRKGANLYDMVWKPLEEALQNIDIIYYSPSGMLNQIAFAALPTDGIGGVRLYDKYDLRQVSSTREIVRLKKETSETLPHTMAVVYGGLLYEAEKDILIAESKNATKTQGNENELIATATLPQNIQRGVYPWIFLKGSEVEAKQICTHLTTHKIPYSLYLGTAGNEESFKNLSGTNVEMIHLATHGFFLKDIENEENREIVQRLGGNSRKVFENPMLRSGVVLAGGDRAWTGEDVIEGIEDGILTAAEIAQMNLIKTKLVVLSACETGLGEAKNSEGVFGLQRAFKLAGVETLIMSLWQVDDAATYKLMTTFYELYLSGKTKREAFTEAQRQLRENTDYIKPYFWAAFVMLD